MSKKLQNNKEKLEKYLANLGFVSRRNINEFLKTKKVTLNNKKAKKDTFIQNDDILNIDGEDLVVELNPETEVLIYHKPTGQVCSNVPTDKNDSVFQGLPARKKGKWIMVGRLDVNTSGLLIFSNDGNLVNFLAHPSSNIDREYLCRVYGDVSDKKIENLLKGVKLSNELAKFSDIVAVKKTSKSKNHWFYVCLFSGKNREVRKLFQSIDMEVSRLKRTRFGPIFLPSTLRKGDCKELGDQEINSLKDYGTYSGT